MVTSPCRKQTAATTYNMTTTDNKRIKQALDYYLAKGETLNDARELALEQIAWEDSQGDDGRWMGPNDSSPGHSY